MVEDRERASESEQGKLLYSEQRRAGGRKGDSATMSKDGQERRRRPRGGRKNKPKGNRACCTADPGGGRGDRGGDTGSERRAGRDDTCHNCNRAGHWAKDCPQPRRNRGAAHVAEGDVDVGLFLAHGTVELDAGRAAAHGLFLELDERRARVVLNTAVEEDVDEWYLDSGATHHMTGRRELFTDLDGDVSGSVRFGDASRVDIQGVGTIAFEGKNGERWLLHGVFYIPALKNSIMSLGRLDKDGSEVRIKDPGALK